MEPVYDKDGITLYNADVLELMNNMDSESVDLVCTDPPYKCTSRGNAGTMGGYWKEKKALDGTIFDNNDISPLDYLPEFYRILKDGTHCYVMINHLNLIETLNEATACGFKFIKSLIWNKCNQICGHFYMNCFEYILMFRKGSVRKINNFSTPDILTVPVTKLKDENGNNLHDTEKPVQLMKILIENSTNEGEVVFEPFAGIGATAIAAKALGRKCVACEINGEYAQIVAKRLENNLNLKNNSETLLF